ncbi:major capsid protein [Devosia faecipullorum]|uniref:major capsid protein n=1 Tax=Devosia faecipullorum TaxID=2755039 RepID=UPI00187BA270|nr:major capsid protein [Devosia faecipullorum]MBE7732168.1 major capsid protein [Devosia faecipullorum]
MNRLYTTTALLGVLRSLLQPQSFLIDRYFTGIVESDKEEIAFDIELHDEQLAPFVAPTVEGKIVRELGFKTDVFTPAYIKQKTPLAPYKSIKRTIGERIGGGEITAQQRQEIRVAYTLTRHQQRITRRLEAMGSEALREGQVTVAGEDYETKVVNFGRDPSLRITLAGAQRWDQADADPIKDLEDWAQRVFDVSGAVVTEVVFGAKAWNAFRNNDKVKALLDIRRADGAGPINIGPATATPTGAQFVGSLGGFMLFKYAGSYKDAAGQRHRFVPDNGVMGVDPQNYQGVRYFGAIMDEEAGLKPWAFFPKSWLQPDPSVRMMMTQCAPLLVPGRKDANYYAEVLTL